VGAELVQAAQPDGTQIEPLPSIETQLRPESQSSSFEQLSWQGLLEPQPPRVKASNRTTGKRNRKNEKNWGRFMVLRLLRVIEAAFNITTFLLH
jgi:hypothetical protein